MQKAAGGGRGERRGKRRRALEADGGMREAKGDGDERREKLLATLEISFASLMRDSIKSSQCYRNCGSVHIKVRQSI